MELLEYLNNILVTCHYPVTFSGDAPNVLNRWLVRSVEASPSAGWGPKPVLDTSGRILLRHEFTLLEKETVENNWRYYNSDLVSVYREPNSPRKLFTLGENKYLYSLANVYCEQERDVLLSMLAYMPTPFKIWINGELVFTSSHEYVVNHYFLLYRFRKGNNLMLVENALDLQVPVQQQEFNLKLNPLSYLFPGKNRFELLDKSFIELLRSSWCLFTEKVYHAPGEDIRVVALPRYFGGSRETQVRIAVYDRKDRLVQSATGTASGRISVRCPDGCPEGVYRLRAESVDGSASSSDIYIFIGDFAERSAALLRQSEARQDSGADLVLSMREQVEMPAVFRGLNQYFIAGMSDDMLRSVAAFENYLDSPDAAEKKKFYEVFGSHYMVFDDKPNGDGYTTYSFELPRDYDPGRRYPLVVFFHDGWGRAYPVRLPWARHFDVTDAIVVNLIGIGAPNYVDDIRTVRTIARIMDNYRIDRRRVYGIGFCTGSIKLYRIAFIAPDLFAGVASLLGDPRLDVYEPEYEYLNNIDHTAVYGLNSVENWFFHSARKIDFLRRTRRSKIWAYHGFTHNEFNSLHNSKTLFRKLIAARRDRYPRTLSFRPVDPSHVKSYWLRVERIRDLCAKATVRAEIRSPGKIEITARNIDEFSLLLNAEAMKLNDEIEIAVNGLTRSVSLGKCARVWVALSDQRMDIGLKPLSKARFGKEYDRVDVAEDAMGIKQVYLHRCVFVRSDSGKEEDRAFRKKLSYLLQNPIKDRYIFYRYESRSESELEHEPECDMNTVHMVDVRHVSDMQRRLLEQAGLRLEVSGMAFAEKQFSGHYFAFIKCEDPRRPGRFRLIVAYNGDELQSEIIQFMNTFDTNPLFWHDAVICHNRNYYSFRYREAHHFIGG